MRKPGHAATDSKQPRYSLLALARAAGDNEVVRSLGITVLLILISTFWFERSEVGNSLREYTYQYIQLQMAHAAGKRELPICIIDINGLPSEPETPRDKLQRIIEAIERRSTNVVIGVDIDLAAATPYKPGQSDEADTNALQADDDIKFLDFCLQSTKNGVPVLVGINRTIGADPNKWLGEDRFRDLATAMYINLDRKHGWRIFRDQDTGWELLSLGPALAQKRGAMPVQVPVWAKWALEPYAEQSVAHGITARSFVMDYGPLHRKDYVIPYTTVLSNAPLPQLDGKVILLGDASGGSAEDTFNGPGNEMRPHTGVFYHACAAYSLLNPPFYELTPLGRLALDLLTLMMILIISLGVVWLGAIRRLRVPEHIKHRINGKLMWTIIILAFLAGVVYVPIFRVMWDDSLFFVIGLLADYYMLSPWINKLMSGRKLGALPEIHPNVLEPPTHV